MKPYNKESLCRKCGERGANSVHHDAISYRTSLAGGDARASEKIKRTCCNCGYEWDELPIDVKKE